MVYMEIINIKNMPTEVKLRLLRKLGYDSDGKYVLKNGKRHKDKYTGENIKIDEMFIYPGSTVVISNNPLSIIHFFEEYGDVI